MMGIICNMLLDFVEDVGGKDMRGELAARVGHLDGYDDNTVYTESDFQNLLGMAVKTAGVMAEDAEKGFADHCARVLPGHFPGYYESSASAREFLKKVPSIHTDFPTAAGQPTAKLTILKDTPEELVFCYNSPNTLCVFLQELARKTAEHFGETLDVTEPQCKKQGAEFCRIEMRFSG